MKASMIKALVAMSLASALYAGNQGPVVKVTSGLCDTEDGQFQGSGYAFAYRGRGYVLTSEHVVIHGNGRYCHSVWNKNIGKISATLRVAEYGNGLALLELAKNEAGFQELSDIHPSPTAEGLPIQAMGYAHGQSELISQNSGTVLVAESTRKLIPLVPKMIETKSVHGEYGMSGGPVFDGEGSFVGIVSHQYLQLIPGGRTIVREYSGKAVSNHLLVIPAEVSLAWVERAVKTNGPVSSFFVRDPERQLRQKEVVLSSGVRFECEAAEDEDPVGGPDGTGRKIEKIGGGDASAVRGSPNRNCTVHLALNVQNSTTVWYLPKLKDWFTKVRQNLSLPWNSVEVPFFLSTHEDNIQASSITGLADFFQKLMQPEWEPVTLVHSKNGRDGERVKELQALAEKLPPIIENLRTQALPVESESFLVRVEIVAKVLKAESWKYLKKGQLKKLCNVKDHGPSWRPLFDKNFDGAVDLLETLNRVNKIIGELKTLETEEK